MTASNGAELLNLWNHQLGPLTRYFNRGIRDRHEAEDMASRTFAYLGKALEQGPVKDSAALLWTIAKRVLGMEYRARSRRPVLVDPEQLEALHFEDSDQLGTRKSYLTTNLATFPSDFDDAVRALPALDRDVLILTELRGLTVREAATVMGLSKSSADRCAQAAIRRVRKEVS
ncbi:MAG TPA: sigma-70 family RNA polymerase sigma factor [Streptosporangiaceae bacterium]